MSSHIDNYFAEVLQTKAKGMDTNAIRDGVYLKRLKKHLQLLEMNSTEKVNIRKMIEEKDPTLLKFLHIDKYLNQVQGGDQ